MDNDYIALILYFSGLITGFILGFIIGKFFY